MAEKSIFAYSDQTEIRVEQNSPRDINYLRGFVRYGRFSDTDAAILAAVALAGFANRRNIERYLSLQTTYHFPKKKKYDYNINKLVDNGFLVRLYASGVNDRESPRMYCLSVAVCALLPQLLGQKTKEFRPGLPAPSACDVLSAQVGFQLYNVMLSDPVFAGTEISVREPVALDTHTSVPAVTAVGNKGTFYAFAIRRQDACLERAMFDAQALIAKLASDGKRGAILFVCEDTLHMESVAAKLPQTLLSCGALLFTYDLSLDENDRVIMYLADSGSAGIGNVSLVRTELEPLR